MERAARLENPLIWYLEDLDTDRPLPRVRTGRVLEADDKIAKGRCGPVVASDEALD